MNGQQTLIGTFPVAIEAPIFQRLARGNARSLLVKSTVESLGGRVLMIGVDRLDYSKGLIQRLDAFDHFLAKHSDWIGKVTYLQITPKNRSDIPEYAELEEALSSASGRLNGKYGEASWVPIRYVNRVYSRRCSPDLSDGACRIGYALARRDEPRRKGVCRCTGSRRSGRSHLISLRRRRKRITACPDRQSV